MKVIYGLYDPRDSRRTIRYVGYSMNIGRRMASHVDEARNGKKRSYRLNWIRSLLEQGAAPAFVILERIQDRDWKQREMFWIAKMRAEVGEALTNSTVGGDGLLNPTPETRKKGRSHSPEHSAAIAAALTGVKHKKPRLLGYKHSAETKANMAAAQTGYQWITDGVTERTIRAGETQMPAGFAPGRLPMPFQGSRWVTDGTQDFRLAKTQTMPPGFRPGRSSKNLGRPKLAPLH